MLHIDKYDLCSSLLGSAASSSAFSQSQMCFAAQKRDQFQVQI